MDGRMENMKSAPMDVSTVFALLQNGLSQDDNVRRPAEAALSAWEGRPGFCSCLLEIIAKKELDSQGSVRWLAVVFFKNSINRYWRTRRDTPGITQQEKPHLRATLLKLLDEENNQVAVQLAVLISKIARFDYPSEWPDLFPSLLETLRSDNLLLNQRVHLVVDQVLKELSTKRLGADQRNFAQITNQLWESFKAQWLLDNESLLQGFAQLLAPGGAGSLAPHEEKMVLFTCGRWLLCLKSLRRMLIFGHQSDARTATEVERVMEVVPAFVFTVERFSRFWAETTTENASLRGFLEKGCIKLLKALITIQETHPYTMGHKDILEGLLNLCCRQIFEGRPGGTLQLPSLTIKCMTFMKNILNCVPYKQSGAGQIAGQSELSLEAAKGMLAKERWTCVQAWFYETDGGHKRCVRICTALVQSYFILTQEDMEEWANDPEGFEHEHDLVQWQDKLRPCAEALFLVLFENFKEDLAPVVMEMLKSASEDCPPPSTKDSAIMITPALLLKDACYDAVGVATYDLYDCVDFSAWYRGALALEIANRHPNGRILRRRCAWLIGQWVSKIKEDMCRPIYLALIELLGDGDAATQLAACRSLHNLIDDVNFNEDIFVEFVAPCLQLLFQFMQRAEQFDSQLQIMNLVSLIIERLGEKVIPCAESIMSFLPQVWIKSADQTLLRIQVMLALQRLLKALGPRSPLCYDLLFPILQYSTDISQPDELNMLEDGMQLWKEAVRQAPAMAPQLMALFPNLVPIMTRNFDHLTDAVQIIESYILVGGAEFLHHHARATVQIVDAIVGNVKEKAMLVTIALLDTLIQCFPLEAPPALEHILQKFLVILVVSTEYSDLVKAACAAVLARVLLQNSSYFAQLLSLSGTAMLLQERSAASGGASPLLLFLDTWLDKIDSMSAAAKRKLSALALSTLLTVQDTKVLSRLEQIFSVCTTVLHEAEGGKNEAYSGYGALGNGDDEADVQDASEDARRLQVSAADPVNTMSLATLLREKLQACAAIHGEAVFSEAMSRVHPSVVAQMQQALQS